LSPVNILPPPADPRYQQLSRFVIAQALVDWKYFADRRLFLKLAVNIPISVMCASYFMRTLRECWPKDPHFSGLTIEVTEDEATKEIERIQEVALQLRLIGVRLSIDDFGVGQSSLARLRDLPCAELKLDRSFVTGCSLDGGKQALCAAAIDLAHKFGKAVCAEGVETVNDLLTLIDLRCDVAQGYLFAKPMEPQALVKFLSDNPNESTVIAASGVPPLARSA
jgi:EAL domain-containing protein (putative c-di-GMP-specific phosphodiesterase class I)